MNDEETQLMSRPTPALDINLRHLFIFLAVADAGSVAAASERLFRASSAVARAITKLEADLGVRLFERRAHGMLLNAYGQTVLARGRRIVEELSAASNTLNLSGSAKVDLSSHPVFSGLTSGRRLAMVTHLADRHKMAVVARELNVTQAAISVGLKELEDRLGVPLFTRSAKGMLPTDAGEVLAFHFRRSLAELRHIGPDLAAMEGVVQGTVRIGALPLSRTRILPSSIAAVLARYPRLHVMTSESPYEVLAAQLRSGELDFVFGALRPAEEAKDLLQDALFDDRISIIARAGHPLASAKALALRDLRDARWVLWRPESPSREMLQRCFSAADAPAPQPSVETGDLAILRGVVLQSDMLTAISPQQLHNEIVAGDLVILPVSLGETRRAIGIAQRHGALPSPGTRVLIDEIRAEVQRMIGEGSLLQAAVQSESGAGSVDCEQDATRKDALAATQNAIRPA